MPSYNFCAICIVRLAENPSLRDASCCRVDVVKGGEGRRFTRFVSIAETCQFAASMRCCAAIACASVPRLSLSSFCPSRWVSRAERLPPSVVVKSVSTDQNSSVRKASISLSRSQMRRRATDCTRPAERDPGNLRHNTGDRLKPIK